MRGPEKNDPKRSLCLREKKIFANRGGGDAFGYLRKDTPESICYNEHVPARKVVHANADALRDGQERNEKAGFYKKLFDKHKCKKAKGGSWKVLLMQAF